MSYWRTCRLSEIAEITPGYAFKSESFTNSPDDVPLVKGENVHQGYVDWAAAKRWPAHDAPSLSKYKLLVGDIVLAMDRPWVTAGLKWAYIKKDDPAALLVQRVARLQAKPFFDQTFLRCIISSPYFAGYIEPIVTGVNVPHISAKQIGDCQISVPPLETQRKIAGILSAYDDLIENNRRQIAILERMAEELYREWFVRMRFPGYQNTKFVRGVPEGWEVRSLGSIYDTTSGGTPSRTDSSY
jgi:type I restriction enzyme, S subunit